jgi:hypothetical protein
VPQGASFFRGSLEADLPIGAAAPARAGRAGCRSTSRPGASGSRSSSGSARGRGLAILLVEQDLDFAGEMADDPIVMDREQVVAARTRPPVKDAVVDRQVTARRGSLWI